MSSFFAFLKRMRFINRWSLMRNTEIENIQEHSLEVAMVAHNLGAIKNEYFGGNVDINKVAVIAMYHEVSEIFTGDMPTPIKYFDPKLRELYGEVETLAMIHAGRGQRHTGRIISAVFQTLEALEACLSECSKIFDLGT